MSINLGTDGYCEATDIQGRIQQFTISATSKPTVTQVETEITNSFNLINGYLDTGGYTVPVVVGTYTTAGAILNQINRDLVAAWTVQAAYQSSGGGNIDESAMWHDNAISALKQIAAGKLSLVDAPQTSDGVALVNEHEPDGEFNLDDNGIERDSVFKRTSVW